MASSFVPLARKWRPRTFADVVGQEEIVRALSNAVSQDRLAHAYLFSGPRGVGKTTSARLLAAAINCHSSDRPTPNPCGTCVSCVEVLEGRSIDALEIDGATHGKVDQARDLIEIVSFAPVRDRRKVFIIDEVHAISQAAFQALLKTLEEPPAHAVFILATTERHKIPATILSRCQRFDFRRLTDAEVAERLAEVARREGYTVGKVGDPPAAKGGPHVESAALFSLAAAATGSLRDGLSLFDQAAARAGGGEGSVHVTAADVAALLGTPDQTELLALVGSILAGDRAAVLAGSATLEAAGADPRATLHDLTALVRGMVRLAADSAAPPPAGLSDEGNARVASYARATPYPTLLRMLSLLSESDGLLRRSDQPGLAFEVLLLRLAELPRLVPIEDLLAGRVPVPPAGTPAATPKSKDAKEVTEAKETRQPKQTAFSGDLARIESEPAAYPDPSGAFQKAVESRHPQLGAVLEDAEVKIERDTKVVLLLVRDTATAKRLAEPAMKRVLDEAAAAVLGRGVSVGVESAPSPTATATDPKEVENSALRSRAAGDEHVRRLLDLFGGEIAEVRRDDGER